jgi:hypothetical protein
MKALKINVENKTITQVELSQDFRDISKEIGNGCEYFCIPYSFANDDSLYADDESLLRQKNIKGGFMLSDEWSYPIVGNAIILGTDEEGESIDCKSTIDDFKDIIWVSKEESINWAITALNTKPIIVSLK